MSDREGRALAEHYFRKEYARMVSVITPYFGLERINQAEDIVQDALLEALHQWEFKGIPPNPNAWLYTVARNKAINALKKQKRLTAHQQILQDQKRPVEALFSEEQIADDQLRMMFACCHPSISEDAQISLMLKTLCGLSIDEIAKAFLSSRETINKRLVRARKTMKENQVEFTIPDDALLEGRLSTVLKTIMLLFNEGYSASRGEKLIRYELCLEAIRLAQLICEHQSFQAHSSPNALLALMLLNASRFEARIDAEGYIVRMVHQDRSLWNQKLINQGLLHLEKTEGSDELGLYHILATISAYHCTAKDYEATNWQGIVAMYDILLSFDNSPLILLNRGIAIAQLQGPQAGIEALLDIQENVTGNYHLFHSALADMYSMSDKPEMAIEQLKLALSHTKIHSERRLISARIEAAENILN